jgi:hypothetical protein
MVWIEIGWHEMRWSIVANGAGNGLEATYPLRPPLRFVRAQDRMFSTWIDIAY